MKNKKMNSQGLWLIKWRSGRKDDSKIYAWVTRYMAAAFTQEKSAEVVQVRCVMLERIQ